MSFIFSCFPPTLLCKSCFLVREDCHHDALPWLYLFLATLGFLTNGLATLHLWRTQKTPMVIFTLNIMVSDLMLCCSFPFRMAYYMYSTQWKAGTGVCSVTVSYGLMFLHQYLLQYEFLAMDQHQPLCYSNTAAL